MYSHPKFFILVTGILLTAASQAQDSSEFVQSALKARDSIKSAELQLAASRNTKNSLGVLSPTRLEAGSGTRPDVPGGEDFTLFQPIDLSGKVRASRKTGEAGIKAAEATLRQVKLGVQNEVLIALSNVMNATRNLTTAKGQLDITKQVLEATKARVDSRALPEIQLTRATLELEKAQQAVIDRQAVLNAAMVKLRQSVGAPNLDVKMPNSLAADTSEIQPERDRPELQLLRADRAGFEADRNQAKLSLAPDLELQARRTPWAEQERYGIRLQLVVPLWDHGAARQKEAAAKRQIDASSLAYADLLKQIQAEIDSAQITLAGALKSLVAYKKLSDGARDLMSKTQRGFELGANSLIDVWDAKRAYVDALDQLSTAQLNVDLAQAELLRSSGQILGEKA